MSFGEYKYLVMSDLYRYTGKENRSIFIKNLRHNPGFQYSFWMRTCKYLSGIRYLRFFLLPLAHSIYLHYTFKYGISIPFKTQIGSGFYIGHFGCIIVHKDVKIGKNCNISQGVTIGVTNRGIKMGCPMIGDNVYIAPGAKVIGNIKIGNNVAIGANCVVTKDMPDFAVVVGVPGKIISFNGSVGYINRTDYQGTL
jgi:serine O-acetyltransferase